MGRVAVVTGGASGMGLGISRRFAEHGHRVAILDLNGDSAQSAARELCDRGYAAIAAQVDVADPNSVQAAIREARRDLGPIEICVTSAGMSSFDAFTDLTVDTWNRVIAVNLTGTFLCIQAVISDMISARWGRIVTISSASGQSGTIRLSHYSAAKGGVIALTKALAREYGAYGITANTIPPAMIITPMIQQAQALGEMPATDVLASRIPVGRTGTPEDIAAVCEFLCSDGAGFLTGQVIGVNGGLQM